jgi:hypothetical protein
MQEASCPHCRCTFNERTGTPFNFLAFPPDVVLLAVIWRLRYKLSLRVFPHGDVALYERLGA